MLWKLRNSNKRHGVLTWLQQRWRPCKPWNTARVRTAEFPSSMTVSVIFLKVYTLTRTAGACAAMYCRGCRSHFCLYCRAVIVDVHNRYNQNMGRAAHDHVFDCQKAPPHDSILSATVLYPVGSDTSLDRSDFLHALNKVQKLKNLAVQIQNGLCKCRSVHLAQVTSSQRK